MSMVPEMDVVVVVPFVVVWLVLPLKPLHGPLFEHGNYLNPPFHHMRWSAPFTI
jgi:hypothetical protein